MAAMAQQEVTTSTNASIPGEFHLQTERIEKLAAKLETANDPETRAVALDLVQSIVELHSTALHRLLQALTKTPEGEGALREALSDDLVAAMLLLHGLHPDDIKTRVQRGIEKVRPYLKLHGGDVELADIQNGVVHLMLHGTCDSSRMSSLVLKTAVEDALFEAAPDIVEIIAHSAA